MQVFGEWAQVEVVELVNDGSGLAFGIVGGRSSGVVVKSVLPGGVADRDGRLRSGDMLLRIGAVSVVGMCARQAACVLRQCGVCVRLLVARPASSNAAPTQSLGASQAPVVPSRLLADPIELERRLAEAGHDGFGALCEDTSPPSPPPTIIEERLHHRPVASIVAVVPRGALAPAPRPPPLIIAPTESQPPPMRLPLDMAVRGSGEPETLSYEVMLNKDSALGLGITVAGYVCEQEELSGIFVKSISSGSSADLCGKIQVNDRIVEVDGVSLHGVTNHRAVALLRDAKGPVVRLKALRYLRGAGFEKLQRALAAQDGRREPRAPPSPSVTSLAKYSFSVYDESTVIEAEADSEFQPHLPSPSSPSEEAEIVIGREEETPQRERRIQDKWRDVLLNDTDWPGNQHEFDIIVGTIMKEKDGGLGISLEGTVRVVGGKEVQARHYIRAIAPNGPVAKLGVHRVGDELLEVNGWRVLGAHHVEVVTRLRAVTSPVLLVCVRKRDQTRTAVENSFGRNQILGGSLQDLLTPPQRLIKAKSESSVASMCSATTVMSAGHDHDEFCHEDLERQRSRSLEPLSGLAMWSDKITYIQLVKEERGLGFSILDYLDPSEPGSSVIVVRSVVAGGAAAADGRLAPGDRLVAVNGRDVARCPLAAAVRAIKGAPRGIVTIGVAKPLPCSTVVGGDKANGHSMQSSQECINSLASDDHTGMDSFHECLQEYGEGLEVVQICLEPEEASIKDEEISAFGDLSYEEYKKVETTPKNSGKVNGVSDMKSSKSVESLEDQNDDMTITEDDVLATPRELNLRSKSMDRKEVDEERCLSKQQSKDISTSDEMVFAVTPTGLERISFDKYWKECDESKVEKTRLEKVKSDESWKECLNSPDETTSFYDVTTRTSVQEENSSLLFIDHEVDGYETCLDEDSLSVKCTVKNARKTNGDHHIKDKSKHDKIVRNKDNDVSAKTVNTQNTANAVDHSSSYGHPYVQEHIIKQMKSLRIEPINVNITSNKLKKRSPTKPSKKERKCVEYYNDQDECLKEIRQKKLEAEEKKYKEEQKIRTNNLVAMEKKLHLKQEPSEESTDLENSYVPGCHKCFLENYAYAITKAYIAEANACKYCEVIRDMLEGPKTLPDRRMSAPALVNLDSGGSETDDEDLLMPPVVKDRRKSAGPLKFLVPSRRSSFIPPAMTVTVSDRRTETLVAQRWGPPRRVTLRRASGAPLGVSIVGGKVDIITGEDGEGEEKAIFGIFIKNVVPGSPAGNSGELQTGDRILEVDGSCVRNAQHDRAVQLIKSAGDVVTLTVQSLLAWNTDSSDMEAASPVTSPAHSVHSRKSPAPPMPKTPQHEIKITVTEVEKESESQPEEPTEPPPEEPKPVYSDDSDDSDEEDERDLGGRVYSDKGVEIDRASAGAVKRSKEEKEADPEEEDEFGYTTNKIRKKYASLGDSVVAVKLERSPNAGLGLSLAGHRDRSRMAVFVCGLHPAGAAAKASPAVKVGDEILEVNGVVLHGRCHLNASAIIKGLVGPVFKIILLRRKSALEDVAVKPLTQSQFPVALEEETEDRFAGYKGVRDITIKKGPSGLGIMIIEGRHTEAGRGIFVSDLQEGSAAEQAGLQIGDMILAVNRDSLLRCSYDAAAAKLKHTEGVVVLTVCTPNLKDDTDTATTPASGGSASPRPAEAAPRAPEPRPAPAPSPVKGNRNHVLAKSQPRDESSHTRDEEPRRESTSTDTGDEDPRVKSSKMGDEVTRGGSTDNADEESRAGSSHVGAVDTHAVSTIMEDEETRDGSTNVRNEETRESSNIADEARGESTYMGDEEVQPGPSRELRRQTRWTIIRQATLTGSLSSIDPSQILIIEDEDTFKYVIATEEILSSASTIEQSTGSSSNVGSDQPGRYSSGTREDSLPSVSSMETSQSTTHRSSLTGDSQSRSPRSRGLTSTVRTSMDTPRANPRSTSVDQDPPSDSVPINTRTSLMSVGDSFSTDFDVQQLSELDMVSNTRSSVLGHARPDRSSTLDCLSMGSSLDVDEPRASSSTTDSGMERGRVYRGRQRIDLLQLAEATEVAKIESEPVEPIDAEPPPDLATVQIVPNQETVIEVNTNKESLGMVLLGGCDTFINGPAAVVLDVFNKGAIGKDKRLQPGDQIQQANGITITEQMTNERIRMSIMQKQLKIKFSVFRPEPHVFEFLEVELTRKPCRALGISFKPFESNGGVYIMEILAGSAADLDGRLQKGDILLSCDGKDLSKAEWLDAAVTLKLIGLRTKLKFKRYKIVRL